MNTYVDTYAVLKNDASPTLPILKFHFEKLLANVKRKISKKPTLNNPWCIQVSREIHVSVFLKFYKALRDFKIRTFRTIDVKKNKKGETKQITIMFFHQGPLVFHLRQVIADLDNNEFTDKYFTRLWSNRTSGKIVVDANKPATMTYVLKSGKLTLNFHYEVRNSYGNLCL